MAVRGTSKYLSVQQEDYIAKLYDGVRSKSSGAADYDAGDVRTENYLIECKMTGKATKEARLPKFMQQFEKAAEEAWEEGREPILALRYFAPDSVLADKQGWVDVVVKRAVDDAD